MHKECYLKHKKQVAKWMRRLYDKGLTTSLGGNISYRLDEHHIAITASETDKGRIKAEQIAVVTMSGQVVEPAVKISMETAMHIAIYKQRSDVKCIVHAHPPLGSVFATMQQELNTSLLAEAYTIIGCPAVAEYATPGSEQLAINVAKSAKESNVVLMANHGVLAVGESLLKAFDRIEVLENAAKMTLITQLLNDKQELTKDQFNDLDRLFS